MTKSEISQAIDSLCSKVAAELPEDVPVAIIGIRTRGEILARRILERLNNELPGREINFGILDITFYRDDLSRRTGVPLVKSTEIEFDIDDVWVLLVDDVLHTGRSIRAALDELHDFGRPGIVRLAVLVDRGGREMPICADYTGVKFTDIPDNERIQVRLQEKDGQEGAYIVKKKRDS
ncbi:MAG TPA: bifunctional pyr operon transcriptional regulator/uracil phosphoribosyltransferase PyrR [Phycisphaerae bacterium]|nr:bifunctional pyr operon transcriptional regulator/uracil phosphoribosyltransferase PyrR [Phycisphaerae bacterium]